MRGFRSQLDRLRHKDTPPSVSIADQLTLLKSDNVSTRVIPEPRQHELLPPGRVVETRGGSHYLVETRWPDSHFHGTVRLDRLFVEDLDRLLSLAGVGHGGVNHGRIAFLDTETTGLHGGAGLCPFLIGVGYYSEAEFRIRQYFIRDFDEEDSMLEALRAFLARFDLVITYNGRAFDVPLVESRCVLARVDRPFDHATHFDFLYMARRLWKASQGSCRLTRLEECLIRFFRGPDIPGSSIPQVYFDYVLHGRAGALRCVFSHNRYDILSLAALVIAAADGVTREPAAIEDPRDMYSLARLFDRGADRAASTRYYRMALAASLPDDLRIRALERLSVLYRKTRQPGCSLACCLELIREQAFSFVGYEGAALCYEKYEGDIDSACQVLDEGIGRIRAIRGMEARLARLESRRLRLGQKQRDSIRIR